MSTAGHQDGPARPPRHPLILAWNRTTHPLPIRRVRLPEKGHARLVGLEAPPWHDTGPVNQAFDFSQNMHRLCADIAARCRVLAHLDVSQLLFGMTQARSERKHGLQARVTPLRFRHGRLNRSRRGVLYQVQRYQVDDREMLYLITFCLPRFLDQDFDDKLVTLFHELYHISPAFDGSLRRHEGRYAVHSHSKRIYDEHMAQLARAYLATRPDPSLLAFLP